MSARAAMGKRILILGGGTGGLVTANKLRKAVSSEHEIILIDRNQNHVFYPSFLWMMSGQRKKEQIQKPLSILERKGIKFINDNVSGIELNNRTVLVSGAKLAFDYLIVALGANTFPETIPGFQEEALNLYDLSGVEKIRERIKSFNKGKAVVLVTSTPFKCPAAPYEAALILSEYFARAKRNVDTEIITPEPFPMPVAGEGAGTMVIAMLQSRGIRFTPQHQMTRIEPSKKEIVFNNGETSSYDLLIGIPPHGVPSFLKGSPLLGESGWIKANPKTLETDFTNIYAIGDVTSIPLAIKKPLPKAGVFAHFQADVVAHNIAAEINGNTSRKEFDGLGYCFIELGDGRAGYASGNFYANPKPALSIRKPRRLWHWGKILFEKWWFWKWF